MIPAIARLVFNLLLIAGAGVAAWIILFVILRTVRYAIEAIFGEVGDFTSWMTKPLRDFIEWRKSRKDASL